MPRLYLLDSWLVDARGHDYQYALDVGAAARERGYEPVIAANRRLGCEISFPAGWRVERTFRHGQSAWLGMGLDGSNPHPCDLDGRWLDSSEIRWWEPLVGWPARLARRRRLAGFSADCRRLFERLPPTRDDLLFFPSMSELEFLCAVCFWRDHAWTKEFDWHLQFHFNFLVGRDPEYASQTDALRRFQRQFREAVDQVPAHRLHFHATTEAVARQYDLLGIAIFHPLPYPARRLTSPGLASSESADHRATPSAAEPAPARPLRVVLPGAMRHEKGKKRIGPLVNALWDELLKPGRMELVFQASRRTIERNLPGQLRGTVRVAGANRGAPAAPILAAPHPLDAEAYAEFLRSADAGLFVYDARRYFARASGVLCELLSAGVPVIVPAACWLADQLAAEHYQHVDALWRVHRTASLALSPTAAEARELSLPRPTSVLLIKFTWPAAAPEGTYLSVTAEAIGGERNRATFTIRSVLGKPERSELGAVLRLPAPVARLRVIIRDAFSDTEWPVERLQLLALPPSVAAADLPSARVGLIASEEQQVPALLKELSAHHEHYQRSAREFAVIWQNLHAPSRTIELLESRTQRGSLVAEDAPPRQMEWAR